MVYSAVKKIIIVCLVLFLCSCNHEISPGQITEGPKTIHNHSITGTVSLGDGLKTKGQGLLFVVARKKDQVGGPPLAVVRIPNPSLPIGFTMSQKSVMIPTNVFEGELRLSAKWSQSGSPLSVSSGDLMTSEDIFVDANQKNIELVLNQEAP